jgi:hypothetical protein
LTVLVLAAWQVAHVLAGHLVADVLAHWARCPTSWPQCPVSGRSLRSKGFVKLQGRRLLGPIQWQRKYRRYSYSYMTNSSDAISSRPCMFGKPNGPITLGLPDWSIFSSLKRVRCARFRPVAMADEVLSPLALYSCREQWASDEPDTRSRAEPRHSGPSVHVVHEACVGYRLFAAAAFWILNPTAAIQHGTLPLLA